MKYPERNILRAGRFRLRVSEEVPTSIRTTQTAERGAADSEPGAPSQATLGLKSQSQTFFVLL